MTIRVLVVENEALVRQGLVRVLALDPEIEVVGEARDGAEGLRMVGERHPDVVLLDVRMPGMGGIDVLRELGRTVACLLLTTFDDPEVALQGLRAGAKGFLLKDVSFEVLTAAIREVAAGRTFARPAVTERILRGLEAVSAHPDLYAQHERLTSGRPRWCGSSPAATPTPRSGARWASPSGRSRTTSPTCWRSSTCAIGSRRC